jgi:hypothetical protein
MQIRRISSNEILTDSARDVGVTTDQVFNFTLWWDNPNYFQDRKNQLLELLESILKERQEDADAITEVLNQEDHPVPNYEAANLV